MRVARMNGLVSESIATSVEPRAEGGEEDNNVQG